MIPKTRPVIGQDIDDLRIARGMSAADAQWAFGMSPSTWTKVVRQGADEPVNPSIALLVRILDENPDIDLIPKMPDVNEMIEFLSEITSLDKKRLSIMYGNDASAGYRWTQRGEAQPPALRRLGYCMREMLTREAPRKRPKRLETWLDSIEAEARARGVQDVFKTGSWTPPGEKKKTQE